MDLIFLGIYTYTMIKSTLYSIKNVTLDIVVSKNYSLHTVHAIWTETF
jgi:hypothetical protein